MITPMLFTQTIVFLVVIGTFFIGGLLLIWFLSALKRRILGVPRQRGRIVGIRNARFEEIDVEKGNNNDCDPIMPRRPTPIGRFSDSEGEECLKYEDEKKDEDIRKKDQLTASKSSVTSRSNRGVESLVCDVDPESRFDE